MTRLLKAAAALLRAVPCCLCSVCTDDEYHCLDHRHGGIPIPAGTAAFTPVSSLGQAIALTGGGVLNGSAAFTCTITAGALTGCSVPDACLTTPANILYSIQITNTSRPSRHSRCLPSPTSAALHGH